MYVYLKKLAKAHEHIYNKKLNLVRFTIYMHACVAF